MSDEAAAGAIYYRCCCLGMEVKSELRFRQSQQEVHLKFQHVTQSVLKV